jgi:DNA-binding response OmpR family regulator
VDSTKSGKELYEFDVFRVDPEREMLLREGDPVPLPPKAFQVLLVLVRNSQEVVTKDDLMKEVWPDTFVEEANLSRNIFLLRKALGESPQDHSLEDPIGGQRDPGSVVARHCGLGTRRSRSSRSLGVRQTKAAIN